MIKKQIPNIFTLLNLLSGVIAILMALSDKLVEASFFVILGIFFDFFDGFFARMFKVQGEFGKQLDSLADVVTSGVAPGFIMFQLLLYTTHQQWFMEINREIGQWSTFEQTNMQLLPFIGFLIPLASAFRLAKFNIDERQTDSFLGLPTPAFALFVVSLPLILHYSDKQIFIDMINRSGKQVISLDIPSGIDATSGEERNPFVNADQTLTLALPKFGLENPHCGDLYLADIGIPNSIYSSLGLDVEIFWGNEQGKTQCE